MHTLLPEEIESIKLLHKANKGVSILWWIFWLIFCWPALFIVALIHFKKVNFINVVFKNGHTGTYHVDDNSYNYLLVSCSHSEV